MLLEASDNVWDDLIDEMSDQALIAAISKLDIDEQIYIAQHLPRNLTGRLLASLPARERARARQMLMYEKNSVGAIMEFEVITVRPKLPWRRCSATCVAWAKCRTTPTSCLWSIAITP